MTSQQNPLSHLTYDELIRRVEDLEEELRMSQAFSNISETGANDATLQWRGRNRFLAEKILPVRLEPVREYSLNPEHIDGHRIIDGDNLSVMQSLLAEFRGGPKHGIDVIYMDPPYNTGEDVFSYNDDYRFSPSEVKAMRRKYGRAEALVSLDDPSRHTKWINHMAHRLLVARKLLKDTGIIIISIDEHELPRLWMLMEEMFDERNRVATLIWERSRKNDARYISEGHEYLVVWARNKKALDAKRTQMALVSEWASVKGRWRKRKDGADAILTAFAEAKSLYGTDVTKLQSAIDAFFKGLDKAHPARAIRFKKADAEGVFNDDADLGNPKPGGYIYNITHPDTGEFCKIPKNGWRCTEETFRALHAAGKIDYKESHKKVPRLKKYLHEIETEVQTSVVQRVGQRAVEVVEAVLGESVFKNPKDHEMLAELFNLVTWRDKAATFLDPYGGSGTTGHAIIAMNAEDKGHRRFIMIENGDPSAKSIIERDRYTNGITAERVRRVISGNWADGGEHPCHNTGFTFFRAREEIDKKALMTSTRESLADVILQVVEEDSNRVDCRVDGYTYLIGRTRLGYGIALVWETDKEKDDQLLTWSILEKAIDEAEKADMQKPIHIYATGNVAAVSDDLYRFHQIPDSILVRLNIINSNGYGDKEADA